MSVNCPLKVTVWPNPTSAGEQSKVICDGFCIAISKFAVMVPGPLMVAVVVWEVGLARVMVPVCVHATKLLLLGLALIWDGLCAVIVLGSAGSCGP